MPVGTVELVSQAEYSRRRGCTEGAVRRAVRDGRISLIDGRIDPVAADAQWARNTRVRVGSRATDDANLQGAGQSDSGAERDDSSTYWSAKATREAAEAAIAQLRLAEMQGELMRVPDARAAWQKTIAGLRESLLQLPSRVVPLLVADTAPAAMDRILRDEIIAALAVLSESAGGPADGRA